MNIAIRLFLGYFLVVGLAAWFVLNIFAREVEPGVRQATEDTLVDTANLLAELAADELAAGRIGDGRFASGVAAARLRDPRAAIWGVRKATVDSRVYVTDARGIVVYDSEGAAVGADYSRWNDVARALRGEYGARSTRADPADPRSSVMHVAAPVVRDGRLVGVLTVAKPLVGLLPYAERARDRVLRAGLILLAASAAIGLAFTLWLTWSLNRLRDYASAVANGRKASPPDAGGRQLSQLAQALALMRERLDGKHYVERYVQDLAHELKSPLSAIRGAAELLREDPAPESRERFARNIVDQAARTQLIIDRLLALARVEQLQTPEAMREVDLGPVLREVTASRSAQLEARALSVNLDAAPAARVRGDPFLLQQAAGNLLDNAIEFSPEGGTIDLSVRRGGDRWTISVRDRGPGAPEYALPHVFERFYSLPRPATGAKSTGLGLAFVREVAAVHGGTAAFGNAPGGGAIATVELPA